ncbi:MAG: CrcB family protein [Rhodococcus sp.]|uniref:fluoride efflux transporter FluC n=1 Tax=Rhodococcus TaxID=1827 RepID=UPI001699D45F|nr:MULTISPECIES: CrcB family protein [Rhodococcus]NLV81083.1 CrcB family protein [Rhodococcus sp. (in: high G+C Gram-positive bacteria)]
MLTVWVGLAGSAGAVTRFVVDGYLRARTPSTFPWATVVINVTGSLLLGVLTGLVLFRGAPASLTTIAGIGFCGGYTTFGTAGVDTVRLLQQRRYLPALGNTVGTLITTIVAVAAGLALTHP